MNPRPGRGDLAAVAHLVAHTMRAVGLVMTIPALLGLALGEVDSAAALLIGGSLGVIAQATASLLLPRPPEVEWIHGMVAGGLAWLLVPLLGAVPLFLSGHFPQFLDAYFDAMSAVTTAGLSVINDLDHLSWSMNLWRHVMQFLGGQGLVLLTLTFFASGGGAVGMYAGEAREDKILPNVRQTARFIWRASLVYFVIGAGALVAVLMADGMALGRSLFHAVSLFFAAFDTGGFSPRSSSIGYYHSWAVESVLTVLMVAGAISFAVHFVLWRGRGRELLVNLETRTLAMTFTGLLAITLIGLAADGVYQAPIELFRRGFFQAISAHTGTGFASVPGALYSTGWGLLAPGAMVLAMTVGGMAGSTTGGIKGIRVALTGMMGVRLFRTSLLPHDAHQVSGYHHLQAHTLDPRAVRAATTVLVLYLALYMGGTVIGLYYGYPFEEALFESTSAAAGVGLSVGITSPDMEIGLQVAYILQMWIGRLEFISGLALIGYMWNLMRGRV